MPSCKRMRLPEGLVSDMVRKGLGPQEIGVYFALIADPQTHPSGVVLNQEITRTRLGLAKKTWNRVLRRLEKAGFVIPSREVKGVLLVPEMSSYCLRTPSQFHRALREMAGVPDDIVSPWKERYREELSSERNNKRSYNKKHEKNNTKDVPEGCARANELVSAFASAWKTQNPGVPFSGGGGLGRFLKSALRELQRDGCPEPQETIRKTIAYWFNPPPDLHGFASSVSYGWEGFIKKYPELLRRVRYDERPTQTRRIN
ncbi:MAG: hypothetical protein ABIM59_05070 [candidate division WOR-3 bacterium]